MRAGFGRGQSLRLVAVVLLVVSSIGVRPASGQAPSRPEVPVEQNSTSGTGVVRGIANGVTVTLPNAWHESHAGDSPVPAALAPYAPPFHLGGILALENSQQYAILQFATSDNPLIGHDPAWLDGKMHMPSGSGMSVLDLIFYYFFPPDDACVNDAMEKNSAATFAPTPNSASEQPLLQVTYTCHHDATLSGFFSAQTSSGITFVQTNDGPRAYGVVSQFYLSPMERVTSEGMTWYVFEALRSTPVSQGATTHFNIPANLQGEQADFFWAIGAVNPFPWVHDPARSTQLIHAAYAGVGAGGSKHADFIALLQRVQGRGPGGVVPQ
jgi:hypothetical protein